MAPHIQARLACERSEPLAASVLRRLIHPFEAEQRRFGFELDESLTELRRLLTALELALDCGPGTSCLLVSSTQTQAFASGD